MVDTTKNLPPVATRPDIRTKKGICAKCDEQRTIVAKGLCTGCGYGVNKDLTREQVLAKKISKGARKTYAYKTGSIPPLATPSANAIKKAPCPTPAEKFERPAKPTTTIETAAATLVTAVMAQREEILLAFVAKYGYEPDRTVQVVRHTPMGSEWSVRWKSDEEMAAERQRFDPSI